MGQREGRVVKLTDAQLMGTPDRTQRFRSTLNQGFMPGVSTLSGGWYYLAAGSQNHLDTHDTDEFYFIASGTAKLYLDGEEKPIGPGDTILVAAGVEHKLVNDGDEELALVYLFSPPPEPRAASADDRATGAGESPYGPLEE